MDAPPQPIWLIWALFTVIFLVFAIIIMEHMRKTGRLKNIHVAILLMIFIIMASITIHLYIEYNNWREPSYEINNVRGTIFYNLSFESENVLSAMENNSIELINDGEPVRLIMDMSLFEIISKESVLSGLTFSNGSPVQSNSIIHLEIYIYRSARIIDINFQIDNKPNANITTLERIIVFGTEYIVTIIESELGQSPNRIEYNPYYDGPEY